jgi:hypothetical protein
MILAKEDEKIQMIPQLCVRFLRRDLNFSSQNELQLTLTYDRCNALS